jgi:hypothetical protein
LDSNLPRSQCIRSILDLNQKEKRNLSKKRKRHINNNTLVKHWFPVSFYCLVLQCNLALFPEMSASQPFRKGSGDVLDLNHLCGILISTLIDDESMPFMVRSLIGVGVYQLRDMGLDRRYTNQGCQGP